MAETQVTGRQIKDKSVFDVDIDLSSCPTHPTFVTSDKLIIFDPIDGNVKSATITNLDTYIDSRHYIKTEINSFFSGGTAITGYNKTNWDAAYTHSQASHLSLSNNTDNYLVTASGTSALNGEANLTFDGTSLVVTSSNGTGLKARYPSSTQYSLSVLDFQLYNDASSYVSYASISGAIDSNVAATSSGYLSFKVKSGVTSKYFYVWSNGDIYHYNNIGFRNKADTAFLTWLTRDVSGSEVVLNLTYLKNLSYSGQITSTIANGTAPFVVTSYTVVSNLNTQYLEGYASNAFGRYSTLSVYDSSGSAYYSAVSPKAGRTINSLPSAYQHTFDLEFKVNTNVGISGSFGTMMTISGYTGASSSGAGSNYQFYVDNTSNVTIPAYYVRTGQDSTWNTWYTIYHSGNTSGLILPTGTSGQTLRHNGTTWVANSVLVNDGTNASTNNTFTVGSGSNSDQRVVINSLTYSGLELSRLGTSKWGIFNNNAGTDYLDIYAYGASAGSKIVIKPTGEIGIGTTNPLSIIHSSTSQASKTTLGDSRVLILENTSGSSNELIEIGLGFKTSVTYQPVIIGHKVTDLTSNTKGSIYFATRDVTTNTAPTERMTITSNGYVGIGTSSPTSLFHTYQSTAGIINAFIIENAYSATNVNHGSSIYFKGFYKGALISGYNNPQSTFGGTLQLQTYQNESTLNTGILIDRFDRVGFGITNPWQKTIIQGTSGIASITSGASNGILGLTTSGGTELVFSLDDSNSPYTASIQHRNYSGFSNTIFPIALNPLGGNVGIGTINPYVTLQVASANSTTLAKFSVTHPSTGYGVGIGNEDSGNSWIQVGYLDNSFYYDLRLQPRGGLTGIGTGSPISTLSVYGSLSMNYSYGSPPALAAGNTNNEIFGRGSLGSDYGFLRLSAGGGTNLVQKTAIDLMGYNGTATNSNQIRFYNSGVQTAVIDKDGKVGIGTTTPNGLLDVRGPIYSLWPIASGVGVYTTFVSGYDSISATYSNRELRIQSTYTSSGLDQFLIFNGRVSGTSSFTYTQGVWGTFSAQKFQSNGDIIFLCNAGATGAGTEIMITPTVTLALDHGGYVGIGTISPNYNLHVIGKIGFNTSGQLNIISNTYPTGSQGTNLFIGNGNPNLTYTSGTSASFNVGIGSNTLYYLTTGFGNMAVGAYALQYTTTGYGNTAMGWYSLVTNTTGYFNVGLGQSSLQNNTIGSNNIAIGLGALLSNVANHNSVAIGYSAMSNANDTETSTSVYSIAIGNYALQGSSTPANNTGTYNTAIGAMSLRYITSGSNNTAVGYGTLSNNTTGSYNITFSGLNLNISGSNNIAIGYGTMAQSTVVSRNIAIGYYAMYYSNSTTTPVETYNTAIGYQALMGSTNPTNNTGFANTAIGDTAMFSITSGTYNTSIGFSSMYFITTASYNTSIGSQALYNVTTGNQNTGIGYQVGMDVTTGYNNTFIGYNTGKGITTGIFNTIIGANVTGLSTTLNNTIIIADGQGNIRYYTDQYGNTGLGNTSPKVKLEVTGSIQLSNELQFGNVNVKLHNPVYNDLAFTHYDNVSAMVERMRIKGTTGKVGIGTNSPTSVLHIYRTSGTADLNIQTTDTASYAGFSVSDGQNLYMSVYGTTSSLGTQFGFNRIGSSFITVDGGNYLGVGTTGTTPMILGTNNLPRLYIESGGKIGIGTTTPSENLTITSSTYPTSLGLYNSYSNTGNRNWGIYTNSQNVGDFEIRQSTAANGNPFNAGLSRFYIESGGKIGIGTTSTSSLLNIHGVSNGLGQLYITSSADSSVSGIGISGANSQILTGDAKGDLAIWTTGAHINFTANGSTPQIRLEGSTGKVGIGINSPQELLHVYEQSSRSVLQLGYYGAIGNTYSSADLVIGHNVKPTIGNYSTMSIITSHATFNGRAINMNSSNGITFHASSSTAVTAGDIYTAERMRIQNNGFVGIGTSSPNTVLDVAGEITFTSNSSGQSIRLSSYKYAGTTGNNLWIGGGGGNSIYSSQTYDGSYNLSVGKDALLLNTTGCFNVALGVQSLTSNTTGLGNFAGGAQSMIYNTTGNNNLALGNYTMYYNTTGGQNVAIGAESFYNNKVSSQNTVIGYRAMFNANNTTTAFNGYNVAIGYMALQGSTTPANNTGIQNVAIGHSPLTSNTSGNGNVGIGYTSLLNNTTGYYNTGIGWGSLLYNTIGQGNVGIGKETLLSNKAGSQLIAIGYNALWYSNDTTTAIDAYNIAIGYQAMYGSTTASNNTGTFNIAIGKSTLTSFTSAYNNTIVGNGSAINITTGYANTIIGSNSGTGITTGNYNTIIGAGVTGLSSSLSNTVLISNGNGNIRIYVDSSGNVGFGVQPSKFMDINSDTIRLRNKRTIGSSTETGVQGEICYDDQNWYVCIDTNTWVKADLKGGW